MVHNGQVSAVDEQLAKAWAALEIGRVDAARDCALRALELAPDSVEPNVVFGWVVLADRPDDALSAAQRGLALEPTSTPALDLAAVAASRANNSLLALRYSNDLVRSAPDLASSHHRLAETLFYRGTTASHHRRAYEAAHRALTLDPDDADNWSMIGMVSLYRRNDVDAAEKWFRKALEIEPNHVEALSGLSAAEESKGDTASAVAIILSVIALDPTDPAGRRQLDDIVVGFVSDLVWAAFGVAFIVSVLVVVVAVGL